MMPSDKPFRTKELSTQINSTRLSFASPEDMKQLLNLEPGSGTVMGLIYDKKNKVQLLVDEEVLKEEYLGCHPCINTSSIKLRTKEVFNTFLKAIHHDFLVVHLTK